MTLVSHNNGESLNSNIKASSKNNRIRPSLPLLDPKFINSFILFLLSLSTYIMRLNNFGGFLFQGSTESLANSDDANIPKFNNIYQKDAFLIFR